jgi:hypothetical protein
MDMHSNFEKLGFLGEGTRTSVELVRTENADWFKLADDLNEALMRVALTATTLARTNSMASEAVAVRVLLRSCGTFQGVVLLTERGMVAEGRTLTRSLLEDTFAIAALHDNPDKFMAMLKEDYEASRRLQGKFIIAEKLCTSDANREKLRVMVDTMGRESHMTPKGMAALGPLVTQYLAYQRLSDDSAHVSARSLHRHISVREDLSGWTYVWGPGSKDENAATLREAILGAIPIGVGITAIIDDKDGNAEFSALADRFQAMPKVSTI